MREETKQALARCVMIRTHSKFGAGVAIGKNLVLACGHEKGDPFLEEDGRVAEPYLLVEGKDAKVLRFDAKADLMLLSAETGDVEPVRFAKTVELDEPIYSIGYPMGRGKLIVHGRVVNMDDNFFYSDIHALHGSSGAGVYTEDGRFVTLVQAVAGEKGFGFPFTAMHHPDLVLGFVAEALQESALPK